MRELLVAGWHSGAGKTTLACRVVPALPGWGALKLSTVRPHPCSGESSCSHCHGLAGPFRVVVDAEELSRAGSDTRRFLDAGAAAVAWVVAREEHLGAAIDAALHALRSVRGIVVEGNSFARARRPDRSIVVARAGGAAPKPGAEALVASADRLVWNLPAGGPAAAPPPGFRGADGRAAVACDLASHRDPALDELLLEIRAWFPG